MRISLISELLNRRMFSMVAAMRPVLTVLGFIVYLLRQYVQYIKLRTARESITGMDTQTSILFPWDIEVQFLRCQMTDLI